VVQVGKNEQTKKWIWSWYNKLGFHLAIALYRLFFVYIILMTHDHKVSLETAQRKDFKGFENGHLFLMGGIDPTKESANPEVLTTEVSH